MRTLLTTRERVASTADSEIAARLARASEDGFWLDLESPQPPDFELLERVFKVHPLAIEDLRHGHQRPKVEDYPGHTFVVLHAPAWDGKELALGEIHLFIGPDFVTTVHDGPSPALQALRDRLAQSAELSKSRGGFLTYLVMDALVDTGFAPLEQLDDDVDALEDDIVEHAGPEQLHRTYLLKHAVTDLRRSLGAQRDAFQRLLTHSVELQKPEVSLYYRDVYDHLVRQYEMVDSLRDLLTSAMDVYLSTVSNKLNQTMKALTVIASLFLPLTFLTGFFGMNFQFLVESLEKGTATFWVCIGLMAGITAVQFALFRWRRWI